MKNMKLIIAALLLLPSLSLAANNEKIKTAKPVPAKLSDLQTKITPTYKKPLPPEVARVQARKRGKTLIIRSKPIPQLKFYYRAAKPKKPVRLSRSVVYPGSLKANIKRIARHFGWQRVVWNVPNDYRWVGVTRIRGKGLAGILRKLLNNYPVQAVFYRGNHVLLIRPRTLQ